MSVQQQQAPGRRIVVGVDGSAPSEAALAWAVGQAELTGAMVEAVIAWHDRVMAGAYGWGAETVDPASTVNVSTTIREGNMGQVLLDAAQGADLLVVGSRGHGGFPGALLGSVSQLCAHHATCPIAIIREGRSR